MEKFSTYQSLAFDKILISLLENEGIVISTPTAINIQKILANTPIKDQTFAKLKYKIAPILCRNKEDQDKIYKIFDDFDVIFPLKINLPDKEYSPPPQPPDPPILFYLKKIYFFLKPYKLTIVFFILGVLGILLWLSHSIIIIKPKVNIEISTPQIINKPIKFKAFLTDSSQTNDYSLDWVFDGETVKNKWEFEKTFRVAKSFQAKILIRNEDKKIIDSFEKYVDVLCEEKPMVSISNVQTTQANKELYVPIITNASKDSTKYTYQWFVDKKLQATTKNLLLGKRKFNVFREIEIIIKCNGAHCDTDSLTTNLRELPSIKSQVIADGKPLELSKSINWKNLLLLILCFFIFPFISSIFLFYLLRKKKPVIPPKIEKDYGIEEPYSIEFAEQDFLINDEIEVGNFADKLRKRQLSEILKLNIRKTITSSLTALGLPQFVFTQLSKPTEYLILFDKEHSESHLTRLFGYLLKKLQNEQVNLTVYEYYKEPLFLSNEKLNLIRIPIERVATFHPEATVIIIGESKNFVYPIKKVLKDWVTSKFRTWETKILLTPFAFNDWDIKERLISEGGFLVIPTDMNAQNNLDKVIFKQVDKQHDLQIPATYPARFLNLQTFEGLKNYLNNQNLLDWVCSLAVYPYTDWNLTIAIGHALEVKLTDDGYPTELVNYSNLLKLGRIAWMHDSSWNEGLRVEMLQQLSNENEVLARETLLKQLDYFKEKLTDKSLIKREFDVHHELNSFLIEAYRKEASSIKKEPIVEDMLNKFHVDEATEIYLNNGKNTLLKNPRNDKESIKVRDYFEASSESAKLNRRNHNIKSFLASTIALILLMMLSYNYLKNSEISKWKKTASSRVTFKFKSLENKMGNSFYRGIIMIDSIQKEFTINKDTSFVLKVPVTDTSNYGNYKLQYFEVSDADFNDLDSFKLNNNSYSFSLESMPQIPVTIYYPANNQSVAETLESFFPGAYDIQKKQTVAVTEDYFVYYFDKKYESYANSCVSIINKNLNKKISAAFIKDTTNSIFPTVPIGIVVPKLNVNDWLPATLPSSLTEIWQGKANDLNVMLNLSKRVLYYSTKGKDSYGTYSIYKIFQKDGKFKVIVSSNKGYKLFFFNNITPKSFDISVCFKYFKTDAELFSINDKECNPYVIMTPTKEYSRDLNRTYLPLNTNNLNWKFLFFSRKYSSNNGFILEYTNNPFLPAINLTNLEKSNFNIKQMLKSTIVLANPFERNFVKVTPTPEPFTLANTSTVQSNYPKKKILWVDDHSENNTDLIQKFEKSNITIKLVYTNAEALALIKNNKFDLVISDIKRDKEGDIAGLNLFHSIRQIQETIPFIFFINQVNIEKSMKDAYYNLKVNLITSDAAELERGVNYILYPRASAR